MKPTVTVDGGSVALATVVGTSIRATRGATVSMPTHTSIGCSTTTGLPSAPTSTSAGPTFNPFWSTASTCTYRPDGTSSASVNGTGNAKVLKARLSTAPGMARKVVAPDTPHGTTHDASAGVRRAPVDWSMRQTRIVTPTSASPVRTGLRSRNQCLVAKSSTRLTLPSLGKSIVGA